MKYPIGGHGRVQKGKIYLVGAGPGDPELLTVKAQRILSTAEVVLYDRLVNLEILKLAPAHAQKIYVGKEPFQPETSRQEFINAQLVRYGQKGFVVVRLKGGDPLVFGRGGEEALALKKAEIPFEFVPGISSAISVPETALIPVTHRGVAASFAVFSGHNADPKNPGGSICDVDWQLAAKIPTAVFLMGVKHLPEIVRQLRLHERAASTPVAVIEKGTLPEQRVVVGTLQNILQRSEGFRSPSIIVIGEVVNIRAQLQTEVENWQAETVGLR